MKEPPVRAHYISIYTVKPHDSIIQLNNLIDAQLYPTIRLVAEYYDSITQTPAQLDFWHVSEAISHTQPLNYRSYQQVQPQE